MAHTSFDYTCNLPRLLPHGEKRSWGLIWVLGEPAGDSIIDPNVKNTLKGAGGA